jgi:nucleoside-diphosphate-sugar epimerase
MGPGDRENLLFFRIARRGIAVAFGGPERPLSWIDVDDCARGLLLLADRPEARGEVFFLASPERTSAVAIQLEAARTLGVKARTVRVPPFALRGAAALADVVSNATGRRLPLNRKLAAQVLAPGWLCDPGKARERLGFEARTPLAESIAAAAAWYRGHGWL